MKTTGFTGLLLMTLVSVALAQTEKGRWQVGAQVGNLTYQRYKVSKGHMLTVNLTPSVGYFVAKNLLAGVSIPFSNTSNSFQPGPSDYNNRSIGIGPFIRYYVGNSSIKPFAAIGFTYNSTATHHGNVLNLNNVNLKGSSTNLVPAVGAAWFINRNVLLSAGFGYSFYRSDNEGFMQTFNPNTITIVPIKEKYQKLSFDVGFALLFGK
ncbi:outer membrane beta-barrel protein [Larkinella humicola]|uniref:Porin family protein n=1 Tax=Larkinella humicola TaxID=2607654 RepID=A0A5N1JPW0_9BACT|nr:outer membrane beta-barrel protein [Larkinella humicola]KAA9357517.1 porin family protein [Larkinella humicola]